MSCYENLSGLNPQGHETQKPTLAAKLVSAA